MSIKYEKTITTRLCVTFLNRFARANQITRTYIKQTSSSSKIKKKNEEEGEDAQLSLTISGKLRQTEQINLSALTMIEDLLVSIRKDLKKIRKDQKKFKKKTKKEMKKINEKIDGMRNVVMEMDYKIERIDEIACPSPLWKLVTDWKDVFEREILTKLNETEQKLFSQTCRASREAVRRAKIKLDDEFEAEREFIARTLRAHFDECFRRDELEAGRELLDENRKSERRV